MSTIRLFNHYTPVSLALLSVIEICAVYAAFVLAVWLSLGPTGPLAAHGGLVSAVGALYAVAVGLLLHAVGLYRATLRGEGMRSLWVRMLVGFGLGILLFQLIGALFPEARLPGGLVVLPAAIGLVSIALIRAGFYRVQTSPATRRRVLFLGGGQCAEEVSERMRVEAGSANIEIVGFIPMPGDDANGRPGGRRISPLVPVDEIARKHRVDEIVVALDEPRGKMPLDELMNCRFHGIEVVAAVNFLEREAGKLPVSMLRPSELMFSDGFYMSRSRAAIRRVFDLAAASVLMVLGLPFMLLVALAIKLEDGWQAPVVYTQQRVGLRGATFVIRKFRSMRIDAEADGRARWATKGDARITRVGRVIRLARLDELPQLINVLRGDMSIVGPRPERPEFVDGLEQRIPFYRHRHWLRPGLTGWAQLCYPYGDSENDAKEKLQYDLYYVKNQSLYLDLVILLRTVEIILFGRGAR